MSYPYDIEVYRIAVQKWYEEIAVNKWFIPVMLSIIENRVNEMINKIFQENPSLP